MTVYQQITPEATRAAYVTLTDKLIHRIETDPAPDRLRLLFLDKSARPVAWLVRALWSTLAREPGTPFHAGRVPALPPIAFANIDREQWWDLTGATETGVVDVGRVPRDQIAQLRLAFARARPSPRQVAAAWEVPTFLDGQRILVIDEVRASGDTLRIAGGLVRRAFPDCAVDTAHWLTPEVRRGRADGVARQRLNPVWYRSDTDRGRLIGNRQAPDHRGTHWRGRVGSLFLSTVPGERDVRGVALRAEIARIGRDVAAGQLLALPATTRDLDDVEERIKVLYGFADARAFTEARMRHARG